MQNGLVQHLYILHLHQEMLLESLLVYYLGPGCQDILFKATLHDSSYSQANAKNKHLQHGLEEFFKHRRGGRTQAADTMNYILALFAGL